MKFKHKTEKQTELNASKTPAKMLYNVLIIFGKMLIMSKVTFQMIWSIVEGQNSIDIDLTF